MEEFETRSSTKRRPGFVSLKVGNKDSSGNWARHHRDSMAKNQAAFWLCLESLGEAQCRSDGPLWCRKFKAGKQHTGRNMVIAHSSS